LDERIKLGTEETSPKLPSRFARLAPPVASEHGLTSAAAIESGMQEKRKEFVEKGSEVYPKT
jgi:hypothetical protein